jgi:DNA-binding CsgD family transcriptional regulator
VACARRRDASARNRPVRTLPRSAERGSESSLTRPGAEQRADKIAERLFLSGHTVRTEIKTIYRKLGVSSRNDAVQQATAIGLLGD